MRYLTHYVRQELLEFNETESICPDMIIKAVQRTNKWYRKAFTCPIFREHVDGDYKNLKMSDKLSREVVTLSGWLKRAKGKADYPDAVYIGKRNLLAKYRKSKTTKGWDGIEAKGRFSGNAKKLKRKEAWGNPIKNYEDYIGQKKLMTNGVNIAAHYQVDGKILATFWDWSEEGVPVIMGVSYANDLAATDWGKVSEYSPGSNITNVCTVNENGKRKILQRLIVSIDEWPYNDLIKNTKEKLGIIDEIDPRRCIRMPQRAARQLSLFDFDRPSLLLG